MLPIETRTIAGLFILAALALPKNALAQGAEQADHVVVDNTQVAYCGVGVTGVNAEPWTLHVAASREATSPNVAGQLKVEFRDGSSITLNIGPNNSISFTQQMGSVPGVDDVVRITVLGGGGVGANAWVSARARPNAKDPFIEPGTQENGNFCVKLPDEGPIGTLLDVTDSWVLDGFGADGGTLK